MKEFGEVGRFAQTLLKYCWQRATEQRDVAQYPNPVFLWADEAHFFVTSHDAEFQSTARSARAATVYLTQNLSNYYAAVGGDPTGRAKVDSLLGNLQTKIFHANGDAVTNLWGAELISKTWQRRQTLSFQETTRAGMSSSDSLEFQLQPISFTRLAKGGPENDFAVDAVVFQAGRQWQGTDRNYLEHAFKQH
ncbi:MAG: type IV secretory system conjugative DNA transfer family protein [Myxococcota bacterium]|nr:type IV secretory system conjugative DNA transfer family protein [Myxococcota bacterium]